MKPNTSKKKIKHNNSNKSMKEKPKLLLQNNDQFIYEENTDYDILTTCRNESAMNNSRVSKNTSYVEQLEAKIQEQAKKLGELRAYKMLCEKRIKQLNPEEQFPLTSKSLQNNKENYNISNLQELNNMGNLSANKDDDFSPTKRKVELINSNFNSGFNNNLNYNYNDSSLINSHMNSNMPIFGFKNGNKSFSNEWSRPLEYSNYAHKRNHDNKFNIEENSVSNNELINNNNSYSLSKSASKFHDQTNNDLYQRYAKLQEENASVVRLLQEQTKITEEQKKLIQNLEETVKNEVLKKTGDNLSPENFINFTQMKNDAENFRKELVLSQALINSLKADNENLLGENKGLKDSINKLKQEIDDITLKLKEKDSEIKSLNVEKLHEELDAKDKIIQQLENENDEIKSFVNNTQNKINILYTINNKNIHKNEQLENDLNNKKNELQQYENKFEYFNDYITTTKTSFINLQEIIPKYLSIYNKLANEDLNSLISSSFSKEILALISRNKQIKKIEKFNLDTVNEEVLIQILFDLMKCVNDEFILIYEKVFETNSYYKELNQQVANYEEIIKQHQEKYSKKDSELSNINNQLNDISKDFGNIKKHNVILNKKLSYYNNFEKINLLNKIQSLYKDKEYLFGFCRLLNKIIVKLVTNNAILNNDKIKKLPKSSISDIIILYESISRLFKERDLVQDQLNKLIFKEKESIDLNDRNNNNTNVINNRDLSLMVIQEKNTLQKLLDEFNLKIKDKNSQVIELLGEIKSGFKIDEFDGTEVGLRSVEDVNSNTSSRNYESSKLERNGAFVNILESVNNINNESKQLSV